MLRTIVRIAGGAALGLILGAFLGAVALSVYEDWANPGRPHSGDLAGLDFLIGGFGGAVVGTIVGAVLGGVVDARRERGGTNL